MTFADEVIFVHGWVFVVLFVLLLVLLLRRF